MYKDFADYNPEEFRTEWVRNECGKGEGRSGEQNGVFEPEYGKGFVARAMLYFFLRYPDAIEADIRDKIDINVLLQWHKRTLPDIRTKSIATKRFSTSRKPQPFD